MNQTDNKIKFFISTSILTFIGLLNLLMVLFLQFDRYVSIEMASGVIFAAVISLVMSALFVFIKRQWIAWVGIIAAGGIVFWIAREAVMGGTAEFINAVINDMAGFFETEMYFIDMSLRLMKEANPDLAINMALCLIGALYAFCFTHKRMAVIPMVISLAFTVLAAIMDKASVAGIVIGIAYSVSLLIMILASWGKSKDKIRYFWVQTACIVCTAAIIAVTMIISAVKPKDDYEKPQYFNDVYSRGEEMYNQFQNGELTINKIIDFVGELLPWDGTIPGAGVGIASGGSRGTKINYPIVQGEENSYYLKHLFSGEWNGSGCIFLDFRNDASFADRHSIIYGHHMKNGTMFTDLDKYKKQEFFDEHPVALLIRPDKNYKVVFFAGYVAAPQDDAWEIGFTEAEFEVWLQNAADRSCFTSEIAPNISDHILTLSTCSYEFDDARFVLAGALR